MARAADIVYLGSVAIFVTSGLLLATFGRPAAQIIAPNLSRGPDYNLFGTDAVISAATLPQLYVQPQNLLMWGLLVVLWGVLLMDGVGQYLDPDDHSPRPAWRSLSLALLAGAAWPWFVAAHGPTATLGALLMLAAALSGAIRARRQGRPAPGFFAGWSLALCTATVATLIGAPLSLTTPQTAILAILPGTMIGMIAQARLNRSLGFSLAIIWAFCAVALSTMGSNLGVALAAIVGISVMGVALVRAAT